MPVRRTINDTITRDRLHDGGETVREFDIRSAATVLAAAIGSLFLIFYVLAFIPWLLANGMTAAVEGMMKQIGFEDFSASTLADWILVLLVGAVFTGFIVAIVTAILWLYNLLSQRTGLGLHLAGELPAGDAPVEIEVAPEKQVPAKRASAVKRSTAKRATAKRTSAAKRSSATKRRR